MAQIERMTVTLPSDMASIVRSAVESGNYASSSEVFRDALRDWKLKYSVQQQEVEAIKAGVEQGLEDLKAGRIKDAEEVLSRLEAKYRNMQ